MYRAQIKALRYFILLALLICGGFVVGGQKTAFATTAINRQLNYQAKLLTANSVPVSDASYSITFSIYDAATGGNRLWTAAGTTGSPSAVSVSVESGLLTVQLGDVSAGQNAFDLNWYQQDLYLGVTIGSDSEMTPRKRLTAVPYAFVAETLQGQYASSSVDSGGTLFSLRQHKADAAAADRAALYISTSGTSNTYDYLIKGSNGSEVFTVSRQGNVTTTGNLATDGNNILGSASSDSLVVNAGVNSNFNPFTNGTYNLGNGLLSWQQIFASSTVHAGGVTSTGHVNPFANDTYDLGALGTAWKDVYASGTAYVQDDVLVGGQSVCLVDGTNCADDRNWKYTLATDLVRNATSTTDIVIGGTATTTAPVYFQLDGVSASSNRLIIGQNQNMNLVLGNTTSSGLNSLFQLSGNDLYVEGNIGSASSVYTNGAFVVGTGSTFYGDGYLSKTDGTYTIKSSSDLVLSPSTGQIAFTPTSGYVSSTAHILSATNAAYNLGSATYSWGQMFASSTVHAGGVTSTGNINPFANDAYDLGLFGAAWKDIYASGTAYVQDDVIIGGLSVCLSDGTNCTAGSGGADINWSYDLATDVMSDTTSTTDIVIGGTATTTAPVYFQLDGVSASSNRLIIGQNQNMNLVLGNTTSSGLNSLFQFSGNDFYAEGNIGSATSVYTNGVFIVGTGSTIYGNGYLSKTDGTYTLSSSSDLILSPSSGQIAFTPTSGYVSSTAHILSATNAAYNLGSATYSWGQMFASSTLHAGGVTSTGNVNPFTDNAFSLGSDSLRWLGLEAVNVTSTNIVTNNLTVNSAFSVSTTDPVIINTIKYILRVNYPQGHVVISGKYAYAAYSSRLVVFDISTPSSATTVGMLNAGVVGIGNIDIAGKRLYGVGDSVMYIVDITNANTPTFVNQITGGSLGGVGDIKVSGKFAYVTAPTAASLAIIDIASSTRPIEVGHFTSSTGWTSIKGVDVQGSYAYVVATNQLSVVDVSSSTSPFLKGMIYDSTNLPSAQYLKVRGRYAYITATNILSIVDLSNPSSPSVVGTINNASELAGAGRISLAGDIAYVAAATNDKVVAINISDPTNPYIIGVLTDASNMNNPVGIAVSGINAYVSNGTGSADSALNVLALSGIDMPGARLGSIDAGSLYVGESVDIGGQLSVRGGIVADGGGIYTDGAISAAGRTTSTFGGTIEGYGGMRLQGGQISLLPNAVFSSQESPAADTGFGQKEQIKVVNNIAYVTESTFDEFQVYDISNTTNTRYVTKLTSDTALDGATGFDISGNYAYVLAPTDDMISIVDIRMPYTPVVVGSIIHSLLDNPIRIKIRGKYAYVVQTAAADLPQVLIFDLTNALSPELVHSINDRGSISSGANSLDIYGNYLYVGGSTALMSVIDITSPLYATSISSVAIISGTDSVEANGPFVYVAKEATTNPISVVDVTVPGTPVASVCVTSINEQVVKSIQIVGHYLYALTKYGIGIFDIGKAPTCSFVGYNAITTAGTTYSLTVSGDRAFVTTNVGVETVELAGADFAVAHIGSLYGSDVDLSGYLKVGKSSIFGGGILSGMDIVTDQSFIARGTSTSVFQGNVTINRELSVLSTVHAGGVTSTGNINPFANDAYDLGLFGAAWKDIYASGTAYVQDDVIIGGLSVCLSDGTNCLAGGGGSQWSYNGTGDFVRPNTNTTSLILGASATANAPFWFKIESTSTRLYLGANGSSTNVVLGNTTASPAIPMHSSFQLDGNDLYVEGNIGSASSVYTNGTFIAGTDNGGSDNFTTYGHGFLTEGTGDYLINAKLGDITLDPVVGSNGTTTIGVETTDRFVLNGVVASDFSPYSDGGYDLGSGSNRWNAFLYNASSVNFEVTGGINSNLNPLANDVYYLGSSSKKWRGLEAINVTTTYLDFTSATGTNLEFTNASGTQLIFEEAYGSDLIVTDNYIYNDWGDRTPGYGAGKFLRAYARDQWYPAFGVMGMVTNTLAVEADIPSLNTIPFAAQDVSTAGGFFVSGSNPDLGTTGQAGMLALHLTSSTRGAAIMGARRCSGDGSNILQLATHEDISRFTVRCDGSVHADKAYDSGGGDYAEFFYTTDTSLGLGEAVALSLGSATSVKRAESADRPYTIGVISSNPAVVGNAGNDSANRENPNFKIVGLMGQVDVLVSTNGGSIQVGDLLMVGNSGFAVKAAGVGMILGQALENLSTTGTIKAYIDPRWSADGIFEAMTSGTRIGNARTAFSTGPEYDSYGLAFQGSAWSTDNVEYISSSFNIFNDAISASSSIFTVQGTTGTNLLTISDIGDMSVKGDLTVGRRLFLGNKTTGAGSTSTYIFVDDTLAPATTYISTNADGWTASTAYDYAEMFFSDEVLKPGDVVTTDPNGVDKIKRTSAPHESVIGIVSTKPGFITGARTTGTHPIALAGRVPTRISTANGVIKAGDQLAISSIPGVAVKAVSSGPIVGVALESYDLPGEGLISVFVQPGWKGGEIIESGSDASDIAYSVEYSTGISPRSGLAKIYAGSNEVQVSFDSLNSYPLITVTPYGQTAAGWWLSNVTDRGFSIIVGEAPMFDLTLAWKAEPSPEGGIMSLSDGTFAPYDPLSGQVFAPEQSDPATEPDPLPPEETVSSTEVVADPLPEEVASAPESSTSTSS